MAESGKRLRELRGIRTRTGVSKETGIPYSSLEAYEFGTREPAGSVKQKLADYYGVSVESIFFQDK
jgi:transcriptional regulator with XRE-family HTH domain